MTLSRKALGITPSPTLTIDARAKQLKSEGVDVIGFGAGEPDFDTPEHIREAAITAIREGFTRYTPAAGIPELKEAVCEKLQRENNLLYRPGQVVLSNGAKHSLANIFTAILDSGDEVLIPVPYWVSYPEMVKLADGVPVSVAADEKDGGKLTAELLHRHITPRTRAIVVNSPSNPTGQLFSREELLAVAGIALQNDLWIISDEIYEKLVYGDAEHISIACLGEEIKKRTVIVNGVSKAYAMTGWRIGYTASGPELAVAMESIQSHLTSNPNSIAQKAALAALRGPQDCVEEMRQVFESRRTYALERINKMPHLSCSEPQGAFYLFVNAGQACGLSFRGTVINNTDELAALLLEYYRVAVVPGRGFGAPEYVRLSYATSLENIRVGLDRMEAFLQELQ
ncbi:MAG: pyridoxal phosphate-dependent aminotransferase [Bacillota bacterium]